MSAMVMSTMIIDYDDNDDDDDFIDYVLTMLMMVIMSNVTSSIHADRFGSIGGLGFRRWQCHLCCESHCSVTRSFKHGEALPYRSLGFQVERFHTEVSASKCDRSLGNQVERLDACTIIRFALVAFRRRGRG